jgi:octopine/nopaline transport system permease protein
MSIDWAFLQSTFLELLGGVPLTLKLAFSAMALGFVLALLLAMARLSGNWLLAFPARLYVTVFRGSPLLVQLFLIYYGLGQFRAVRASFLWPFLREPYWCAILALTLNTAAYASEVIRGGILAVPKGQIEAARACGMSSLLTYRRIILPQALRHALPGYGNELIAITKATALASTITLMEVTGIAARLMNETYRAFEVFTAAGLIYLLLVLCLTQVVAALDYWLTPHLRQRPAAKAPA